MRDPLFLGACALYAANRFLIAPRAGAGFWTSHFNDLLVIPAALPPLLALYRALRIRLHDRPPTLPEVALHAAVWAAVCEGIGPVLTSRTVADPWDVAAYGVGATAAGIWWNWAVFRRRTPE